MRVTFTVKISRKSKKINNNNTITAINRKNDLNVFISNSTPGFQFSLIVLFAIVKNHYQNYKSKNSNNNNQRSNDNFIFSFSSREFRDTYSRLAGDLGLLSHLVREIAFPEYTLTLLYLGFIREKEETGEYEFSLSYDESKWLASIALDFIQTGLRSTKEGSGIDMQNLHSNQEFEGFIKEIMFARNSSNQSRDNKGSQSENLVSPRSRDYGKKRPSYFPDKQPPTTYGLRKKMVPDEINRLQKELTMQSCDGCGRKILLDDFDIWIGDPIKETPSNTKDQRISDMHAGSSIITKESASNKTINFDSKPHITDREILEFGYSVLPMDGRDGFIAFAKPVQDCPTCGYKIWNSV